MTHIGGIALPQTLPHGQDASTFPEVLALQAAARGSAAALLHKRYGLWQTWTWGQLAATAARWAGSLSAHGVQAGETVIVAGANSPRLWLAVLACQWYGAVPVVVPQPDAGIALAQALAAHPSRVVFAAGEHEVHAIYAVRDSLQHVPAVICNDLRGLRSLWTNWLQDWDTFDQSGTVAQDCPSISPAATAAIVYAPGENGRPIALTHRALLSAARAVIENYALTPQDRSVMTVPFGWPTALLLGPVRALVSGAVLAFPESDSTVLSDLGEIEPSLLFGPPALFRQLRQAAFERTQGASRLWRDMLDRALGFTTPIRTERSLLARWLLRALRDRLGLARLRAAIITNTATAPQVGAFMSAMGAALHVFADSEEGDPLPAAEMESRLAGSVFIRTALVTETADGAAVALVALDPDAVARWAQQRGELLRSIEDIAAIPGVRALLASEIGAAAPRIARFLIARNGLSPQTGDVAPDGRLLREEAVRRHGKELDLLRNGGGHDAAASHEVPAPRSDPQNIPWVHAAWDWSALT